MDFLHRPVLLEEILHYLSPADEEYKDGGFMADSTLGEGGHSLAFLERFPNLHIIGIDADESIQSRAKKRLSSFGNRMQFYRGWFTDFYSGYPKNLPKPDIILFDLGISVYHYEASGRGFSFRLEEALDMRLDSSKGVSAEDLVNSMRETELADMLFCFGEERYSRRIARAIAERRKLTRIVSAKDLADCIYEAVPSAYRHGGIHPATKSFQALRIAVNKELEQLQKVLAAAFNILNTGGKMGLISFHSLEDRIVKNFFRDMGKHCICPPEQPICKCGGRPRAKILTSKPVCAGADEIKENAPSRSAKLRVLRKL